MKRIAIAGCAHIHTPNFVKTLKERKDLQVAGVWDHDSLRARENAEILNTQGYDSDTEIWNDPSIDAVVICAETNRHKELVLRAAEAGKHMFVEKPLGLRQRMPWRWRTRSKRRAFFSRPGISCAATRFTCS